MKRVLIILMLLPWLGFAQGKSGQHKAPPMPAKWPIASLAVTGNHIYSRDQILAVAGLKIGEVAGKPEFDAARDRLVACGAFETVGYRFEAGKGRGYDATIEVAEVQQAYPIRFEELHVSEKDLLADLRSKDPLFLSDKLAATQPVLDRYAKWIQAFVKSKGEPDEKIQGMLMPDGPEWVILFRPARDLPAVAQVTFEGNLIVPENVLRAAVAGAAIGAPYTEDSFRAILNASVRPVYEARGRVRVSFTNLRTEPASDVKGIHVFVTVDEGESFELGNISVEDPCPIDKSTLLAEADFKTHDVANVDRINAGLEKMRLALRRDGYMDAHLTTRRKIDDDKRIVNLFVDVESGNQYLMGKLTLVGLDLDGEAEMKRIWTLQQGKPFDPEYPDVFLKRVKEEGLFDHLGKTKADTHLNQQAHTADVTLTFSGDDPSTKPGRHGGRGRGGGADFTELERRSTGVPVLAR
ncbi:MAG TPA: POTRA domain-containing protein [Bryobacteraceae bacterium]|nr:POTRA domain-containing protein [Bryobacteraceae bacterium]